MLTRTNLETIERVTGWTKCASAYIVEQGVHFLLPLSLLLSSSAFPLLRYVCLDKCIRSSLPGFFYYSPLAVVPDVVVVVVLVVVCNNRENTAADGQHAFASVHSFKRGGTHARSVHNDMTKGTKKNEREGERDVNLRRTHTLTRTKKRERC